MSYLEFSTQTEAQSCLDAINMMARQYWVNEGFTVADGGVVGKKSGDDNYEAVLTTTWDTVREIEGKFYIASLSGTPFEAGMGQLTAFSFIEVKAPPITQGGEV